MNPFAPEYKGFERRSKSELYFWFAIVVLRAAATNVADLLTGPLDLGYVPIAAGLAALALLAGTQTRPVTTMQGAGSPLVNGWYWTAMAFAGVFGTAAGDLVSHTVGVVTSAGTLTTLLLVVLVVREQRFAQSKMACWVIVLVERAAGTPLGDGLASRHGAGLGLQLATACSAMLFATALVWRARQAHRHVHSDHEAASEPWKTREL
jgi:uncharacterized membrane-anchored protein